MKIADITHGLAEMIKFLKRWKSLFCQTPSQLLKPKKKSKKCSVWQSCWQLAWEFPTEGAE